MEKFVPIRVSVKATPLQRLDLRIVFTHQRLRVTIVAILTGIVAFGFEGFRTRDKFAFWKQPSFFRGAAINPYGPYGEEEGRVYVTKQDFQALRAAGANVVSLNYPGPFAAKAPYALDAEALRYLDNAVNWAGEVGLYVIIHFRNGPGKSEQTFYGEDGRKDETVWHSEVERMKWAEMWKFVAQRYKDRSHVIAYNLMVEPHPEDPARQAARGAGVWVDLAKRISTAIREKDKETPIIVSATGWANPASFSDLVPTADRRTIYSFHMYEPFEFTHQGFAWAGKEGVVLTYPGEIPSDLFETLRRWDKSVLEEVLRPVVEFQKQYQVPIHVGEFGCNSQVVSCRAYLDDLIAIFEKIGWSHTFWAWRTDDGFDYEKEVGGRVRVPESQYMKMFKKYWKKNRYYAKRAPRP